MCEKSSCMSQHMKWTAEKKSQLQLLIASGKGNTEIGQIMGVSARSIRAQRTRLCLKTSWTELEMDKMKLFLEQGRGMKDVDLKVLKSALGTVKSIPQIKHQLVQMKHRQEEKVSFSTQELVALDCYSCEECHELFPEKSLIVWQRAFKKRQKQTRYRFTAEEKAFSETHSAEECAMVFPTHSKISWISFKKRNC